MTPLLIGCLTLSWWCGVRADTVEPDDTNAALLLITADELVEAWTPFATWKSQGGKRTALLTVEDIASAHPDVSIQEAIRLTVRQHIDECGTRWVLLGGDCVQDGGLVPGGHVTVHAMERRGIPTDIVYLSPTNWDADGDGQYGEWQDDREAITYPDGSVGLGRVPVRTAEDVKAFTEKVMQYESSYPTDDFATSMLYTCTDQPAYPKVRNSWDGYLSKEWEGTVARFFSDETPWDEDGRPGSHALSAEHLVDLFNGRTVGKMHIHGHGHLPQWMLERSTFGAEHVAQLDHAGAYPLMTTVSCNTGEYDHRNDPSIVEAMIRQPNGGSVAIVAPIRTGKPHFHDRSDFRLMVSEGKLDGTTQTMTRYWLHGLAHNATTGEAFMRAKSEMIEDARKTAAYHLCICELNLLGDPTLDMRARAVRTPTVKTVASVPVGAQTLRVSCDVPFAMCCVTKGDEVFEMKRADDAGRLSIDVHTSTLGSLDVTVFGPSLNRVSQSVAVTPVAGGTPNAPKPARRAAGFTP